MKSLHLKFDNLMFKSDFINLGPALLCSLGFFGLFMSVNSAMNLQTLLLEDDGYGKLGLILNAFVYFGVCLGGLFSSWTLRRWTERQCMQLGAGLCIPYLAALILPCAKAEAIIDWPADNSTISAILLLVGFIHGFGEGLLFVA